MIAQIEFPWVPIRECVWERTHQADDAARPLADRHYNRRKIGGECIVPPGRHLVLLTGTQDALWVTSWQKEEYVRHAWPGAWVNSTFRNESPRLASELIREAVAITIGHFGTPPELGMITFVDTEKVRHKRDPGRCYLKAGFKRVGYTKGGLLALQLKPSEMPPPVFLA